VNSRVLGSARGPLWVAILAGIFAGMSTSLVVSALLVRRDRSRPPAAAAVDPPTQAFVGADRGASLLREARLARLEQRLSEVERQPARAGASDPPAAPVAPDVSARRYEEQIRNHDAEPADPRWAASTASFIETDLRSLAAAGTFKLVAVDCRTQLCVAELEWPSPDTAGVEYAGLVQHPYPANCPRTMVLPDSADPGQPVKAKLLFDCASWRAGGSQPFRLEEAKTLAN
jgi:hypothetical protein